MRYTLLFLLLFIQRAHAQTGAGASGAGQDYIQVSQEPRHHKILENEWVRVLDVRIPPGDTSLFHKHSTPSVFIVLSNTRTGSQVLVESAPARFTDGHIWFESFRTSPRIHRVWNSDTTEFHVIDLEVLNKTPKPIDPPMTMTDLPGVTLQLLFDEAPVRGYRLTLLSGSLRIGPRRNPILVAGLSDDAGSPTVNGVPFLKKGAILFVPAGKDILFTPTSTGAPHPQFALLELK